MSQFNIRSLREIHSDEQGKFINILAKRVSTFFNKQQTDKLENKEDIYSAGQDTESVVKFHDFNSTNYFDGTTLYYPPFEPDNNSLRLWLMGHNLGNRLKDWSETPDKICTIIGDPLLIDGTPFNSGIHTGGVKSTCLRFNRPVGDLVNTEYMSVNDNPTLQIATTSTGKSYFMRFRVSSLASQEGHVRTLFEKTDDDTPNNGVQVQVSPTGRIRVSIKRAGVEYNQDTATGTIAVDTVYDVWITYAVSGNVIKVYVNNVDKSLVAGSSPSWHATLTNHDLFIFRKGIGTTGGFVEGDFYDFRIYNEKVVSAAEVGYIWTNKWTIANIPHGQVAIANYFAAGV